MNNYVYYNPNPLGRQNAGDCTIRAISKAMGYDWERTYTELCLQGFMMGDMPSANSVWGTYLINKGFEEHSLMRRCRECYSLIDFCNDFQKGTYVVGTDKHAVCVIDGCYFDSYDSGDVNPTYYFYKTGGKSK